MKVHQAATMQIEAIQADAPIREAAKIMETANIGLLLVAEGDQLVGVVTDRDIVTRAVALGGCICKINTRSVMSHPVVCVDGDSDLQRAVTLMAEHCVRRLIVLNAQKVPVGVLSIDDIAFCTHGDETAGIVLEGLAHGPQAASLFRAGQ